MKVLSVRRRYYKNRTAWEDFDVLYKGKRVEDGTEYILVREQAKGHISFGLERDFNDLYFFPTNQSCLTKAEAIERLNAFIGIADKYGNPNKTKAIWQGMLEALK